MKEGEEDADPLGPHWGKRGINKQNLASEASGIFSTSAHFFQPVIPDFPEIVNSAFCFLWSFFPFFCLPLPKFQLLQKAPEQEKRLPDYCSTAIFIQLLLTQGYQFDERTFPDIAFQKKVGTCQRGLMSCCCCALLFL